MSYSMCTVQVYVLCFTLHCFFAVGWASGRVPINFALLSVISDSIDTLPRHLPATIIPRDPGLADLNQCDLNH